MARTEMIQASPSVAPAQQSTPPNSPSLPSSEHVVTLSNAQEFIDMIKAIVAMQPASKSPDSAGVSEGANPDSPEDTQPARASKLEYMTVTEVWDDKEEEYRIEESLERKVKTFDEYVFVMRTRIDKHTKDPTFYIDIKSEELRDILRKVLKDVYGISLMGEKPTVERHLLYHYLPELESHRSTIQADTTSMKHLDLLIDCVKRIYAPTTARLLPLLKHGEITYDLLWALFKPNTPVYTTCSGTKKPRCVTYDSAEEKTNRWKMKYFSMDCRYFDFDGIAYGKTSIELVIPKFRGTQRINTLPAFPLKYHRDKDQIKSDLINCGRKFVSLIGTHHVHCQGEAFYMYEGDPVTVSIDSRVIVDADFFWKMNPNYSRPRADLAGSRNSTASGGPPPPLSKPVQSEDVEPAELKEDDLLICCPTVLGFSFGEKLWAEFAVTGIKEIEWSSLPFDCLSIPNEQRDVIMALVEARLNPSVAFDDFIVGKGKGTNILLHGPPGVGKTLTAEAVSEHLKRPLYSISAGELPVEAAKLEGQLSRIFKTASHWNAILLLDEADVFLEQRSPDHLTRNGLVSVFLRKLEYCQGILFLTTNRVSQFDQAILSRIHLMLRYDNLAKGARKQVWEDFLSWATTPFGKTEVAKEELEELTSYQFNGRQIKNIVAAAQAFAVKEGSKIRFPHIEKAVKANEKFFREFYGKDFIDSYYG